MKVLVERHENEKETTHKFTCMKCGSELEFTPSNIINGCIIPIYAQWDTRMWKINIPGVQCPICNEWYSIDKNYNINPINGKFERE